MSVSVVNGYLCMSSCDAAKARHGENPREPKNLAEAEAAGQRPGESVVFGGVLAAMNTDRSNEMAEQRLTRRAGAAVDLSV